MNFLRLCGLGVLGSVLLLLAACGGAESGTATMPTTSPHNETPAAPDAPPENDTPPENGVPTVPKPLDTDLLLSEPCALLDETQRAEIGLTEGKPQKNTRTGQEQCSWQQETERNNAIFAVPMPEDQNGLSDIYAQQETAERFEPVTINGYPAAFGAKPDAASDDSCLLFVGITDQQVVNVGAMLSKTSDPDAACQFAQVTAEAMIDTLKD